MTAVFEKPGGVTPWPSINQLLDPLERFETASHFLLAPKSLSKLSALLYLLKEERFEGDKDLYRLSLKAFSQADWIGDGCVAVGAGCELSALQNILFEQGLELGLENFNTRDCIGAYCLAGAPLGIVLGQESLRERILEAQWVKPDGGIVKWGKGLAGAGGPCFAPLIWGLSETRAVLIKLVFKASPVPPVRLFLHWSYHDRDALWNHFNLLRTFTSSWERLDIVIPEDEQEKGFVIAQISGVEREMEAFRALCPFFQSAGLEDKASQLKAYFKRKNFHFTPASPRAFGRKYTPRGQIDRFLTERNAPDAVICDEGILMDILEEQSAADGALQPVKKRSTCTRGVYVWQHGLTGSAWIISDQSPLLPEKEEPLWKQRLEAYFDD